MLSFIWPPHYKSSHRRQTRLTKKSKISAPPPPPTSSPLGPRSSAPADCSIASEHRRRRGDPWNSSCSPAICQICCGDAYTHPGGRIAVSSLGSFSGSVPLASCWRAIRRNRFSSNTGSTRQSCQRRLLHTVLHTLLQTWS